jgi:hypothetical protein
MQGKGLWRKRQKGTHLFSSRGRQYLRRRQSNRHQLDQEQPPEGLYNSRRQYRIYAEDLLEFLNSRGMRVPEELYRMTREEGRRRF